MCVEPGRRMYSDGNGCGRQLTGVGRFICVAIGVLLPLPTFAQQPDARKAVDPQTFDDCIGPFLGNHCQKCHGQDLSEGELRLDLLEPNFQERESLGIWVEVLDRINLGEMPPQDEPRPDAETLAQVTDWISGQLQFARRQSDSTDGRVMLRRLSRLEYANTVRDLLHVEFVEGEGPIDLLPPDGSINGFDRLSKALLVDPSLIDSYFQVAQAVADQAVRFRPPIVPEKSVRFDFRDTVGSAMEYLLNSRSAYLDGDMMVVLEGNARTFGKLRHPFNGKEVPATGRYRVRVRAASDPADSGQPVYMNIKQGPSSSIAQFRVDATPDQPIVYEFVTTRDELFQGEYDVGIVDGTQFGRYVSARGELHRQASELFDAGQVLESTRIKARLRAQGDYDSNVRGAFNEQVLRLERLPKLYLDWIEVTGPLQGEYPPASMKTLFFDGWQSEQLTLEYAKRIFQRLLPRAYRRPVTPAEVNEIVSLVAAELGRGSDFQTAIKTGLIAILCSPKFLYLHERSASESPRELDDFELASRLSYFLWSSMPDDQLLRLAVAGSLKDDRAIAQQIDRMLSDTRIEGFLQGFVRQWLKVDEFERFPADERIFPQYYATEYAGIDNDITEQPIALLRELILRDESILHLIDSDWTMVNERLAMYYGIDGVRGEEFQRVALTGRDVEGRPLSIRGGLIGMAGVHRWGSDGNRTKPVERGKYILDVLFNDPPPPPPPNAGEVEPNIRGENLSVRDRLNRHRQQVTCNNCHRRIDPYGLALENFNVIGQWRDRLDGEKPLAHWGDDRPKIDPSGKLPGGDSFINFPEFKRALLLQQDRFIRGLVEKLLTYALARTVESSDRPMVDQIVAGASEQGLTLRSLIKQIATTEAFQQK